MTENTIKHPSLQEGLARLLFDIGNSTIVIAYSDSEGNIKDTWRVKTIKHEAIGFFRREIRAGLYNFGLLKQDGTIAKIDNIVVSSVVPEINDKVSQAIFDVTGITPHFFSLDDAMKVIDIQIESPSQLGKDRLADAIGARCHYGAPAIIIDMGTATTIGVVNDEGAFIGGMIMPGVKTSLKALTSKASQLPTINIEKPRHMIGRNTLECMQSGIIYGTASMIDGLIDRIIPTLGKDVKLIATGGNAHYVISYCKHNITFDPYLQFKGIMSIASQKNEE